MCKKEKLSHMVSKDRPGKIEVEFGFVRIYCSLVAVWFQKSKPKCSHKWLVLFVIISLSSAKTSKLNCQVFPAVSSLQCCTTAQSHVSCSLHTLQCILVSMSSAWMRNCKKGKEEETRGRKQLWEILEAVESDRKIRIWCGSLRGSALLEVSKIHLSFLVWEFSNICQKTGIQSQLSQIKSLIQNTKTWATSITHLYTHEGIKSKIWISFTAPSKWNYFKSLEVNIYGKAFT